MRDGLMEKLYHFISHLTLFFLYVYFLDEIIDDMISYLFDFGGEMAFHDEKDGKMRLR